MNTTPPRRVSENFRIARERAGWTQHEASDQLFHYLGYHLKQAGISTIERTATGDRTRSFNAFEIVAFAECFGQTVSWFFTAHDPNTAAALELALVMGDEVVNTWYQTPKDPSGSPDEMKLALIVRGELASWHRPLGAMASSLIGSGAAHNKARNAAATPAPHPNPVQSADTDGGDR